jgi:uncharacterized protein HemX
MTEIQRENTAATANAKLDSETSHVDSSTALPTDNNSNPKNPKTDCPTKKYLYTMIMVVAILLLIISASLEGYLIYQKDFRAIKQKQGFVLFLNNVEASFAQQRKDINDLQNIVQQQSDCKSSQNSTALMTSYQLLTTANSILQMNGDKARALALMLKAENQLADFPEFLVVNKILADDIAAIKATVQTPKEDLILQLQNLNQRVETLTPDLIIDAQTMPENTTNPSQQNADNSFKCILKSITNALQNIIIISHKKSAQIVLTTEQATSVKLNLKMQLSEAEWAIMYDQPTVYQTALLQIINSLNTYFAKNDQVKNNFLPELQKLQQIKITKPLNTLVSLNAIEDALSHSMEKTK